MTSKKDYRVLKVKDPTDSYTVNVDRLMSLPFRCLICAKSGHGKSNLLTNIFYFYYYSSSSSSISKICLSKISLE